MTPTESQVWRLAVYCYYLPSEDRHHALERLVAYREVRMLRAIVLAGCQDGVVGPELQHMVCFLWLASIHAKGVLIVVDSSPVGKPCFEGRLDFPVFYQVLDGV